MLEIIKLVLCDEYDDVEYFILKDKKYEENILSLQVRLSNYETFQEIEDFIYDNFIIIDIKDVKFQM